MIEVTSTACLAVVLVCVEANLKETSILMAGIVSFTGLMFDSHCGIGLYCCSCGFLGLAVVYQRPFLDPCICLARLVCDCLR